MDYEKILSQTVQEIKPSGIRKFFDLLGDMQDVIALTVGQPDFVTPWHIRVSAIESLEKGKTYYTSNSGTLELRTEISNYMNRRYGLNYDPLKEIIVTVGGSEAIDVAMRALINPGDEVIVPQPSFVCYGPIASMTGGVPVYLETKEKDCFKLTPDALRAAITPKTKLLVLPFPNNPTGANCLCAADTVLVPVQCEYYALEGLSDLLSTIRAVKARLNPGIDIEGLILTMYDGRTNLSLQVAEQVKRHFPGKVFATAIPRNVRLSEAPSHGKPVIAYDGGSRGAKAYMLLAEEFLARNPLETPSDTTTFNGRYAETR